MKPWQKFLLTAPKEQVVISVIKSSRARATAYSMARYYVGIWLCVGMCVAFVALIAGFSFAIDLVNALPGWRGLFYFYAYWVFVMSAPVVLVALGRSLHRLMFPPKQDSC